MPPPRRPSRRDAGHEITVRMYNAGFGDCFMIVFPPESAGERPRKVLIDCGGPERVVQQVIEDAQEGESEPRLDVVVATHRHRDHVRGFESRHWRRVVIGEVWLPWTEHPHDDEARYVRALQSSRRDELIDLLRHQDPPDEAIVDAALSALLNDDAMKALTSGFKGSPPVRYLPVAPAGSQGEETESQRQARLTLETESLRGIEVSILGPSRLREVIANMEPPRTERFLRLSGGLPTAAALASHEARQREELLGLRARAKRAAPDGRPVRVGPGRLPWPPLFDGDWVIAPEHFPFAPREGLPWLSREARDGVRDADGDALLAVGASLEAAENGTSLLLMFRLGAAHLLFAGDAEWGTWEAALREWEPLLRRTTFLKVGHHGSYNATPRTLVEKVLPRDILAMVPTLAGVHNNVPLRPLMKALRDLPARVVLSNPPHTWEDWPADPLPNGFRRRDATTIEATIPVDA